MGNIYLDITQATCSGAVVDFPDKTLLLESPVKAGDEVVIPVGLFDFIIEDTRQHEHSRTDEAYPLQPYWR